MTKIRKALAMLLCTLMCIAMLPAWALAEDVKTREPAGEEPGAEIIQKVSGDEWSEAVEEQKPIIEEVQELHEQESEEPVCEENTAPQEDNLNGEAEREKQEQTSVSDSNEKQEEAEPTTAEDTEPSEDSVEIETVMAQADTEEKEEANLLSEETEKGEIADLMAASGVWGDNLQWELNDSGVLRISGNGEMDDEGSGSYGEGYPWYPYRESVRSIIVSQGITSIASAAFAYSSAKSVELPESLKTISNAAFFRNLNLADLQLPSSLETIGWEAFVGTLIYHFHIPASVTSIGGIAFLTWRNDTIITVDPNNPIFSTDKDGALYEGDWRLIWCPVGVKGDYTIKETVETVESYAFSKCSGLTSIVFPPSVKTIGSFLFNSSQSLKSVWFIGVRPDLGNDPFYKVKAEVYYHDDGSWKEEDLQNYGGTLTWIPIDPRIVFLDVSDTREYYFNPVYWAVELGITSGTSPTTFSPNKTCTRGQIVTFLWKALKSPELSTLNNPFTDVSSGDYFYKPVLWAKENEVTSGKTPTTFEPMTSCTRGQIMTFLWIALGRPEPASENNPFTDVSAGDYFYKPVLWAVEKGITAGTSATTFSPGKACTRAQAMTFLYKAMN